MAPMGENKDGADTQPKRTGEMKLQHEPELWKQPVVLNMGVNLSCRPMLSITAAAWASDGGSQPERLIRPCCYTQVPGSPTINPQPKWKPGKTHSPQQRRLAWVTGVSTLRWGQVSVAAELLQEKGWGEDGCKSPCQLPHVDVTQEKYQGGVSVYAYLGSLSHWG